MGKRLNLKLLLPFLLLLIAVFCISFKTIFFYKPILLNVFVILVFGILPQIKIEKIRRHQFSDYFAKRKKLAEKKKYLDTERNKLEKQIQILKNEIQKQEKLYEISTEIEKINDSQKLADISLERLRIETGVKEIAFFKKEKNIFSLIASRNVNAGEISLWERVASGEITRGYTRIPLRVKKEEIGCIILKNLSDELKTPAYVLSRQITLGYEKALLYEEVEALSRIDGLTGFYLRRFFMKRFEEEIERAERYNYKVAFVMCDIDDFKKYNDTFGHQMGDRILEKVAEVLRENLKPGDVAGRYGGEEFCIFAPVLKKEEGIEKAEGIRRSVEEKTKVTISIGVSYFPDDASIKEDLIKTADEALYRAKKKGKNRVEVLA